MTQVVTWYDQSLDMYVTQDEHNNLTYTSVAEYLNTNTHDDDSYLNPDELSNNSASNVTKVDSNTFKRYGRDIFAYINKQVIYLENTQLFHAEMIEQYLSISHDMAWELTYIIDRGYIDKDKHYLDIYRGMGTIKPNLQNAANIVLTLLNNGFITNSYLVYFCGGKLGITTVARFMSDYYTE